MNLQLIHLIQYFVIHIVIPQKSPEGICPSICFGFCPPACLLPPPVFQDPSQPPPPPPIAVLHKHYRLSLLLTVSLSILATAFFLFTCYTIYKFYCSWYNSRRRPSQRPEEDGGSDDFLDEDHVPVLDHPIWYIRTIGLQPSVISAITIVKYKRGEGLIEGTDCSVCLNEFQDDETLRLLPKCNHAFHIPCIDTWLRSHTNCPMCRAGIVNSVAASLPSDELVVQNPCPVEENQLEISRSNSEVRRSVNESSDSRPGIDDDGISRSQSGLKLDEDISGLDGALPLRRSVSFDSLSASMISAAIANAFPGKFDRNSDDQSAEGKESGTEDVAQRVGNNQSLLRLVESPSIERSIRTVGTSSIKRSVSCTAKVLLSRHGSSRNWNC